MRLPILRNNTNLILFRAVSTLSFRLLVNFALSAGGTSNTFVRGKPLFPKLTIFGLKKLEASVYRMVQNALDMVNRLDVDQECNGQTDRTAIRPS